MFASVGSAKFGPVETKLMGPFDLQFGRVSTERWGNQQDSLK